jgi:ribosomal protein L18e/L15
MKAAVTAEVRLDDLNKIENGIVTLEALKEANLLTKDIQFVKVILAGEVKTKLVIRGLRVTKGARAAIEAAGGSIEE